MQISSRFTEYGLTGGFFWICQLLVLAYYGQAKVWLSQLSDVQKQLTPWISPIGSTAISALAIIAVFVTGLLLDLLAVYFRQWEMRVFHRHLDSNRDWLGQLIVNYKGYCEADYEAFQRQFGRNSVAKDMRVGCLFWFRPWNRQLQEQYFASVRRGWGMWKVMRSYERLWSFFTSYVFVQSGSSQLNLMVDQYYLWRAGRAVSVSLAIMTFEVWFLNFFVLRSPSLLLGIFQVAVTGVAILITAETYSRLCFTLFALVYVTQNKRSVELEKTG